MSESQFQSVRSFVRLSANQSHRRASGLSLVHLSSSAACQCTAGTLAPEPVPPLSLLHLTILPALQRSSKFRSGSPAGCSRTLLLPSNGHREIDAGVLDRQSHEDVEYSESNDDGGVEV